MTSFWRPRRLGWLGLAAMLGVLALARPARAALPDSSVRRFAVLIGNDAGARDETPLRYAESDAAKMAEVLGRVGGFDAENVVVLRAKDSDAALKAIIAINDRIRARASVEQSLLFVYYSGHGDRSALHLGGSRLELASLEQLVRGSAATVRLLVVDACHSGALTRVKGGRSAPRMNIDASQRLAGEGIVFLTSSSASEEAQESDELQGSFFTHYLSSGLLGAADQNQDGVVVLKEAYRHAYENTIRASSRTEAGIQHPTFRYELGGQGDIVLSRLELGPHSTNISLPEGTSFLLFQGGQEGAVVAEVDAHDRARSVHVKPGSYYVRGRADDYLLEGRIEALPGAALEVDIDELERVDYARMARRGGAAPSVQGPALGYQARTAILRGATPCHGPFAAYVREGAALRFTTRLSACRGHFTNSDVAANTDEVALAARFARAWDTPFLTFDAGGGLGVALLHQSFETAGVAPARNTLSPQLEANASVIRYLPAGFHLALELGGLAYALPTESSLRDKEVVVRLAARLGLQLGVEFASF